jgi:AcrR family transcriptional regulator
VPGAATLSKRDAILGAALELFSERTFASTPMPELARRAGVGAGTIYRYFDSKDALVNALFQRWKREMTDAVSGNIPDDLTPREQFTHWWRGLWKFATELPSVYHFLETHHHAAYLDAASRRVGAQLSDRAITYLREGQRRGAIRKGNPEVLMALVMGAFTGLVKSATEHNRPLTHSTLETSEAAVWALLAA